MRPLDYCFRGQLLPSSPPPLVSPLVSNRCHMPQCVVVAMCSKYRRRLQFSPVLRPAGQRIDDVPAARRSDDVARGGDEAMGAQHGYCSGGRGPSETHQGTCHDDDDDDDDHRHRRHCSRQGQLALNRLTDSVRPHRMNTVQIMRLVVIDVPWYVGYVCLLDMTICLQWRAPLSSVAVLTIRRQSVRSLDFLQAEWIPMLTDSTSVSIALSQLVRGRPQGLLQ